MSLIANPRCQNTISSSSRLAARPQAGHDLADLGVQVLAAQRAVGDQPAVLPPSAAAACAQSSTTNLSADQRQRGLGRAHGAVGHHERARRQPLACEPAPARLDSREASTTMSAPSTADCDVATATTGSAQRLAISRGERARATPAGGWPPGSRSRPNRAAGSAGCTGGAARADVARAPAVRAGRGGARRWR